MARHSAITAKHNYINYIQKCNKRKINENDTKILVTVVWKIICDRNRRMLVITTRLAAASLKWLSDPELVWGCLSNRFKRSHTLSLSLLHMHTV